MWAHESTKKTVVLSTTRRNGQLPPCRSRLARGSIDCNPTKVGFWMVKALAEKSCDLDHTTGCSVCLDAGQGERRFGTRHCTCGWQLSPGRGRWLVAKRAIIRIDEERCDGCALCVTACAEGAIAMVDGKARLVSETYCDGLGACLGECPQGAITLVEEEAAPFDEQAVAAHLAAQGRPQEQAAPPAVPAIAGLHVPAHGGCPGSRAMSFEGRPGEHATSTGERPSMLRQWPVQLHLVSPVAPYLAGADLLLAADCVAFSVGDFHKDWLAGKALAIACPKLDANQEVYLDKLVTMIDRSQLNTITVMIMEVPCCRGLLQLARTAASRAQRKVPVKAVLVGLQGGVLNQQWL